MKNKIQLLAGLIIMTVMLSGCSMFNSVIPEMTDDERNMVVEYAAQSLLKYDKKHGDKVTDKPNDHYIVVEEPVPEEPEIVQTEENSEEVPENQEETVIQDVTDVSDNTATEESIVSAYSTIGEAVHIPDSYKIELAGMDIDTAYPKSTDAFFVINATKGTKLLIMSFELTNISDTDSVFDMSDKDLRFRVRIDGNQHNMLTTLLTNDLSYYKDTVAAGESKNLVLIAEIKNEDLENMNKVELVIKDKDETSIFDIR